MCGIFSLIKASLNIDLTHIKEYVGSFIEKNENDSNLSETNIEEKFTANEKFNINLRNLLEIIKKRGPDFHNIIEYVYKNEIELNSHPKINFIYNDENIKEDLNLIQYVEEFKQDKIFMFLSSVLNLRGVNNLTKQPIYDTSLNNLFQYNGEIFGVKKEINTKFLNFLDLSKIDLFYENDGFQLFKICNEISKYFNAHFIKKQNSNMEETCIVKEINELYAKHFLDLMNNIESDHAFVFFDNLNKKILISRDLFGKRSLLIVYIKMYDILIFTSSLSKELYLIKDQLEIYEVPSNCVIVIDILSSNKNQSLYYFPNNTIKTPSILRFPKIDLFKTDGKVDHNILYEENKEITKECYIFLRNAVAKRINNLPDLVKKDFSSKSSIAILFSGGIDSLLLSYMVADLLQEDVPITIDLINLAFTKDAPDRQTGLIAYYELLKLFPKKHINLVIVDKSYEQDVASLKEEVQSLIFPNETHMDFNISTALKLASQLKGKLLDKEKFTIHMDNYFESLNKKLLLSTDNVLNKNTNNYCNEIISKKLDKIDYLQFINPDLYSSNSKIVLSGLGADELFGGYARYRNPFYIEGMYGLACEMSKDIDRIWTRNFGRDDRVCSHNGIELRFPFLDIELISFLSRIDQNLITNFNLNRGEGEKILLRNIVKMLNFKISFLFEKRAIQFGTRLAKETNIKTYGSNRKANGKAQFK